MIHIYASLAGTELTFVLPGPYIPKKDTEID